MTAMGACRVLFTASYLRTDCSTKFGPTVSAQIHQPEHITPHQDCCNPIARSTPPSSAAIVIADFFGQHNPGMSDEWETAAWLCMVVPAVYSLIGGMNASLMSDAIQTVLAFILLFITYGAINSKISGNKDLQQYLKDNNKEDDLFTYNPDSSREMWSLAGGVDLVLTGILQGCLSYTFMDPALTDRAFLASPRVMLPAYLTGSVLAFFFIMIFGCIGTYGNMLGSCIASDYCNESDLNGADLSSLTKGYPDDVGKSMGPAYYSILCLIMITSAMSTLDSTFSGIAKLFGPDLNGFIMEGRPVDPKDATHYHVTIGRVAIVLFAIAGTLPIYGDASTLSATTVTGTMAPGLGPPIYMGALVAALAMIPSPRFEVFKKLCGKNFKRRPAMFLLPFLFSAALGVVYQITAQSDNCYASKVLACGAPSFSSTTSDMCDNYDTYFACIDAAGCWSDTYNTECTSVKSDASCSSLSCYGGASKNYYFTDASTKTQYSSFVDLSGFNIGTGSYGKLLGVNCISALGAFCFFLFVASDDFLAIAFPEPEVKDEAAEATPVSEKEIELVVGGDSNL